MRLLPLLLATLLCASLPAQPALELEVRHAPQPYRSGGEWRFVYELHVRNAGPKQVGVRRVAVLAGGKELAQWEGPALGGRFAPADPQAVPARLPNFAPGQAAVCYLEFQLPGALDLPPRLEHQLVTGEGAWTGGACPVDTRPPVVLGPPLRGGPWAAIHAASWSRGHRRVLFRRDGPQPHIPARFAIDWVRLDERGAFAQGDEGQIANHFGYGAEVLAGAEARVVGVRDSIAEDPKVSLAARPLEEASGNFVTLDLGDGRFAHYEHLQPGSLQVKVGDQVKRGQVLARLGNTGDSTGPHLHLHVSTGATPWQGEGVPYAVDGWEALGRYVSMDDFGKKPWTSQPPVRRVERPQENEVGRF